MGTLHLSHRHFNSQYRIETTTTKFPSHPVKADNSGQLGFALLENSLFARLPFRFGFESSIEGMGQEAE